jgi:hypothetical protein
MHRNSFPLEFEKYYDLDHKQFRDLAKSLNRPTLLIYYIVLQLAATTITQ